MKELTIKKETLDVVRQMVADGQVSQEVAEKYFPELRESENERIRKEIIRFIRMEVEDEIVGNKWLAWLEKQEGCEHIRKEWLEHIKQSWYKEGFIDGKYSGGTSKEWTINDTTTLNELIDFLENGTAKLQHDLTRYANWLKIQFTPIEKQGEQKPKNRYTFNSIPRLLDMIEPTDRAKSYCQKLIDSLLQEGYATDAKIVSNCLKQMNGEKVAMATMDEQKPADNVEPKFHIGDYVVDNCGYVWKIEGILNQFYILEGIEGGESRPTIEWVNKTFHLWTIADAKDGDVLACENGWTCIFKCLNDNLFSSHCFMDHEGWFCEDGGQAHTLDNRICGEIYPATKEQRDLLFEKMKEAGYQWDADKKELKKFHIIDEGKAEMDYCFTKMMNGEKVSSAWSEEDIDKLIIYLHEKDGGMLWGKAKETAIEICNILKPQPKQEWTKEDEKIFDRICALIHSAAYKNYDVDEDGNECGEYANIKEWFKKLKDRVQPQITWKPNDTNTTSGTSNWPNYLKG